MLLFFILHLFFFLGLLVQHAEVPRLGVESALLLPAYTTATEILNLRCVCDLHCSSRQHQILNPGRIKPAFSWILVGLISAKPWQELLNCMHLLTYLFIYFCLFAFSRATPGAYGDSQARGLIGAGVAGLRQSHSNWGSEPSLRPTPHLTATVDP